MKTLDKPQINIERVGWWQKETDRLKATTSCPVPVGCKGPRLFPAEDGLGWISGIAPEEGALRCQHVSDNCDFTVRVEAERAKALALHIGHFEFFETGLANPLPSLACRSIAASKSRVVILASGVGRGKDFAIARCLFKLRFGTRNIHWFTAQDLVSDMARKKELYDRALNATPSSAIVVEDLGTEPDKMQYGQGGTREHVAEALSQFIGCGARVFISTNLALNSLCDLYGERVASRLRGFAEYITISDNEPDYRQQYKALVGRNA